MTVDGDTSTSDTVPAVCHRRGGKARRAAHRAMRRAATGSAFGAALHDLMRDLALQVAKDGEGLTQVRHHRMTGAESEAAARRIGFSSPTRRW